MPFIGTLLCHHTPEPDPIVLLDRVSLAAAQRHGSHQRSPRTPRQVWEAAEKSVNSDALPAVAPPAISLPTGLKTPSWLAARPPFEDFAVAEIVHDTGGGRFLILIDPILLLYGGTLQAVPTLFALPARQYVLRIAPGNMALLSAEGANPALCEFHPDWQRGRYALTACT